MAFIAFSVSRISACGSTSKAELKSTATSICLAFCLLASTMNSLIFLTHPPQSRFALKPNMLSGKASFSSKIASIFHLTYLATSLPTACDRQISLYFLMSLQLPLFFQSGTPKPSLHSSSHIPSLILRFIIFARCSLICSLACLYMTIGISSTLFAWLFFKLDNMILTSSGLVSGISQSVKSSNLFLTVFIISQKSPPPSALLITSVTCLLKLNLKPSAIVFLSVEGPSGK